MSTNYKTTQRSLDAISLVNRADPDKLQEFLASNITKDPTRPNCSLWTGTMHKGQEPVFSKNGMRFFVRDVCVARRIRISQEFQNDPDYNVILDPDHKLKHGSDQRVLKPECGNSRCISTKCLRDVSRKMEQRKRGQAAGQAAKAAGRVGEESKGRQRYSKPSVVCLLCGDRIWDTKHFREQHSKRCNEMLQTEETSTPLKFEQTSYRKCDDCGEFILNAPDEITGHYQTCKAKE